MAGKTIAGDKYDQFGTCKDKSESAETEEVDGVESRVQNPTSKPKITLHIRKQNAKSELAEEKEKIEGKNNTMNGKKMGKYTE